MSEKLLIEFEVKKEIAKNVSLEANKFYFQTGIFEKSFSDFSKKVQALIYGELVNETGEFVLRLRYLPFYYEKLEEKDIPFEAFDFTSDFFEGKQVNEFILHYFQIQKIYAESKSKPTPNRTSQKINKISITYLLHPNYVEAKKIVGEELSQLQHLQVKREDLSEDLFLSFVKHMTREEDKFCLDLTKFDEKNEKLFAPSSISYASLSLNALLRDWHTHLEQKEKGKPTSDEKQQWIEQFGSHHLKRAYNMNYNCQRQYVTERVAKEHPDFILDFDEQVKLKERPFPSEKALDIEETLRKKAPNLNIRIQWMQKPEKESEVVVIHDYLGKYLLYKKI